MYVQRISPDDIVSERIVEEPKNLALDDNPTFEPEPTSVPTHPENIFPMIYPPIKGQINRPKKPKVI